MQNSRSDQNLEAMLHLPDGRLLLRISVPIIASLMVQGLYSLVDSMFTEDGGVIIRIPASSINVYKRDVQGVIVMRLEEGNQVVSVERIDKVAEDA